MRDNDRASDQQEQGGIGNPGMAGPRIISYNLSEGERPGGIKVRYKIRVVSGPRAKALDSAQARVIREVLEWSRTHRQQQGG
jgi:hypothetical protein